jgi:hypothetical protein
MRPRKRRLPNLPVTYADDGFAQLFADLFHSAEIETDTR